MFAAALFSVHGPPVPLFYFATEGDTPIVRRLVCMMAEHMKTYRRARRGDVLYIVLTVENGQNVKFAYIRGEAGDENALLRAKQLVFQRLQMKDVNGDTHSTRQYNVRDSFCGVADNYKMARSYSSRVNMEEQGGLGLTDGEKTEAMNIRFMMQKDSEVGSFLREARKKEAAAAAEAASERE